MDPIEIFEIHGYVVDASASSPATSAFLTEMRGYLVQRAQANNAIFTSEIRAYAILDGAPNSGIAINTSTVYIIAAEGLSPHYNGNNTLQGGHKWNSPGIVHRDTVMHSIEPDPLSRGFANNTRAGLNREPGILLFDTIMYTIEVP